MRDTMKLHNRNHSKSWAMHAWLSGPAGRLRAGLAVTALAVALAACPPSTHSAGPPRATPAKKTQAQMKAETFLKAYLGELAALEKVETLAYWKAANSGKKEDFAADAKARLALKTLHSDPARYKQIVALLGEGASLAPLTRRSLEIARLAFAENQLPKELLGKLVKASAEIEQIYTAFRGKIGEQTFTNNQLLKVLRTETNEAKRRQAWEALKQVGAAVGPKLVALARIRNEAARTLGYANFWDMQVRLQEHDPKQLLGVFDELARLTDKPFAEMKARLDAELAARFHTRPEALMPWHYDNPFFQAAPPSAAVDLDVFYKGKKKEDIVALARRFYADIGLPADGILARSDLYERPGKDQHAFCTDIDRAGDVRVLTNIKATAEWMDTILHELGHAVYDEHLDPALPFNLRAANHIFTTEGVAMLFGALGKSPDWIRQYAGADSKQVATLAPAIREQRRREQLIFARFTLVMLHFEKALYEHPEQDLNKLWWQLAGRYQGLRVPPGRDLPDWASKPHFTIAPVYYHNYMLGELFAAQLRQKLAHLGEAAGAAAPAPAGAAATPWFRHQGLGAYLIEHVFRRGMRDKWPAFVREATGAPLSAAAFAREVGSPQPK